MNIIEGDFSKFDEEQKRNLKRFLFPSFKRSFMNRYITQLLADISYATQTVSLPFVKKHGYCLQDWLSPEEEDNTAPVRQLEEWTGIKQEMLPPADMLNDEQVHSLLVALNKMLSEYNWHFVMQIKVPERIQYDTIRHNFNQEARVKQWDMGFFEFCIPGTKHKTCPLGEYCHCAFFAEMFSHFKDEELTPEEERRRELEIEIKHLKRKYDDDWMKYYPYHLDPEYDDEHGNPHDYGASDLGFDDDDDEDDNWWRR